MTEHTQGPWKVGMAMWNEDDDVMYTLEGIKYACAPDSWLIAAAPDMLKALEAQRVPGSCFCHYGAMNNMHAEYCMAAEAAIDKAKGQEQ